MLKSYFRFSGLNIYILKLVSPVYFFKETTGKKFKLHM